MKSVIIIVVLIALIGCVQEKKGAFKAVPVVTMKGTPVTLVGTLPKVGQKAPNFSAFNSAFQKISLSDFAGKYILISAVPSLDTPVCSKETKRFNDELKAFLKEVVIITISMDLPFAQKRFCDQEKIDRAVVLSDSANQEFGKAYGVIIKETGLLARSIFIVDKKGKITYIQIVPEISNEPDYGAALGALTEAIALGGGFTVW